MITEKVIMEKVHSDRTGAVEHIVIERVYESVQDAPEPTPMLHTNYDALSLEEKVERLELVAKVYLTWLLVDGSPCEGGPEKALREDCTRYWPEMKAAWEGECK